MERPSLDDETAADFMRRMNTHDAVRALMRTIGASGRVDVFLGELASSQMVGKRSGERVVVQINIAPFQPGDEIKEEK